LGAVALFSVAEGLAVRRSIDDGLAEDALASALPIGPSRAGQSPTRRLTLPPLPRRIDQGQCS
jgi:hypothetical protein